MQTDMGREAILKLAGSWKEDPATLAEAIAFASRFYRYSTRNTMMIYAQNPYATYVQSFQDWKEMGYSIRKGEHGIRILVPVQKTLLLIGGEEISLEKAPAEVKKRYKRGEIEGKKTMHWKIGNVFDISQTTFPKEEYPKLFSMGIPDEYSREAAAGLMEFAKEELGCEVERVDMRSITLRGDYRPGKIRINALLEDTQQLSTLTHEIGHAVMDHTNTRVRPERKEFEADAFSIMVSAFLGIRPTDARKRHLAEHFTKMQKEEPETDPLEVLQEVQDVYRKYARSLETYLARSVDLEQLKFQELTDMRRRLGNWDHKRDPSKKQQQFAHDIALALGLEDPGEEEGKVQAFIGKYKEDFYKIKSTEQIEGIKRSVRILDYAKELGYTPQKVGRYYTLKEMDSIRIDPSENRFWRNSQRGVINAGTILDFAAEFGHGSDLSAALRELKERYTGEYISERPIRSIPEGQAQEQEKRNRIEIPEAAGNMHRVFAYLVKTRYLDQDIVQDFVHRKMLYQDERGNCVFLTRDTNGQVDFAFRKGTLSEKKFFQELPGCDYEKGFYIANGAKNLIVTESVIDAMSIMTILKGQGQDPGTYDYLSLNGTGKYPQVANHLKEHPKERVLLALDHDMAGVKAVRNIFLDLQEKGIQCPVTCHLPQGKDWNQDLTEAGKRLRPLSQIPFLEACGVRASGKGPGSQEKTVLKGFQIMPDIPQIFAKVIQEGKEELEPLYLYEDREQFYFYYYTGMAFDRSIQKHTLDPEETTALMAYQHGCFCDGTHRYWQVESDGQRDWMGQASAEKPDRGRLMDREIHRQAKIDEWEL